MNEASVPAGCPRCGGPRVWIQHHGQPEARCRPCTTAKARARRQAVEPLIDVVRAFLAEGLPMTHSAYGVACAFCGVGVEELLTPGHAEGCRWVVLKARVAGEL